MTPPLSSLSTSEFAVRWTRVTFYGWSLGFALILVCLALAGMVGLGDSQFPVGLGMGLGVGLLQRRLVADRTGSSAGWLAASALGVTAPFLVRDIARLLSLQLPYALAGSIVIGGLVAGLLQGRVLRLRPARAAAWAAASVAGWALGGATLVLNERVLPKTPGIIGALIYVAVVLIGGILLGATTGLVLPRVHGGRG
jgi:hypothetical protein